MENFSILSYGNKQNLTAIPKQFPQCAINYALKKKIKKNSKIVSVVSRVILGGWRQTHMSEEIAQEFTAFKKSKVNIYKSLPISIIHYPQKRAAHDNEDFSGTSG